MNESAAVSHRPWNEDHRTLLERLAQLEQGPTSRGLRPPAPPPGAASLVSYDLTTGLPNRWSLQRVLDRETEGRRSELLLLVLVDTATPEAGDEGSRNGRLRAVGHGLGKVLPPGTTIGRWSSDQLLAVLRASTRALEEVLRDWSRDTTTRVRFAYLFPGQPVGDAMEELESGPGDDESMRA